MNNSHEYKLIDGTFSAEEAGKVLTALINYKIDYHSREDFSNHIRFNSNIEHSKKRIVELIATKEAIASLVSQDKSLKQNFVISGTISIRLED